MANGRTLSTPRNRRRSLQLHSMSADNLSVDQVVVQNGLDALFFAVEIASAKNNNTNNHTMFPSDDAEFHGEWVSGQVRRQSFAIELFFCSLGLSPCDFFYFSGSPCVHTAICAALFRGSVEHGDPRSQPLPQKHHLQ